MMQGKKTKYDVIGLTETRRPHPLNAVYDTGEELFSGTCYSTGVVGVGVPVNTSMPKNIDSCGSRCGATEAIKEDLKERRAEVLAEAAEAGKSVRYARRDFASRNSMMTALRNPKGTTIASRRGMEKIFYDFYSDLFDSHVHLPPHHLRGDGHVIPEVLPSEVRHAIMSVRNRTAPGPDRIRSEEPSASTHQHPGEDLHTLPVGMQGLKKSWMKDSHASKHCFETHRGITRVQDAARSHLLRPEKDLLRPAQYIKHQPSGTNADRIRLSMWMHQLNLQKTMFMRNGWVSDVPFTLNGTNISECTSYVYLGRELNMMNDLTPNWAGGDQRLWERIRALRM
ncbi:hypothetical protein RB195_022140 [Necator americanus]|uniref:Uncharacterized protein n=1 Tax=Necator americanus TaxID=51031 RepID=A0ABR1EE28_NECAM